MKKNLLVAVLSLAAVASLASCGNGGGETTSVVSSEKEEPVKHTVGPADGTELTMWVSQADSPAVTDWVKGYNAKYPDEKVKVTYTTMEEGDVGKQFTSDSSNVPNIVHVPGDVLRTLETTEAAYAFNKDAVSTTIGDDISGDAIASGQDSQGVQYGLPFSTNTYFLMYDKKVYSEEQVSTLDAMMERFEAYKAEKKLDDDNKAACLQLDNGWYIQSYFMSNGGIFADNGTSQDKTNLVDKGLPVARYLAKLYKSKDFQQSTGTADWSKVFAYVSGTWDYAKVEAAWGKGNVGVAHLPDLTIDGNVVTHRAVGDFKYVAVSNSTADSIKPTASKFALYMDSAEGQKIRFAANNGTAATSVAVTSSDDFAEKNPAALGVAATLEHGTFIQNTSEKFKNYWNAATAFTSSLYKAVNGSDGSEANDVSDDELTKLLHSFENACLK